MRPMRVGLACYPTYGGSGVMATELGIALAERGHEVHLFSYAWPSRLPACHPGLQFHGITVSDYPLFRYPPYDLALASSLREVMQRRELDVLHAHYAVPHALCAWLAREMAAFNDVLRTFCRERNLGLIHLAPLDGDPACFYDDCHFTREGATRVADLVAGRLRSS